MIVACLGVPAASAVDALIPLVETTDMNGSSDVADDMCVWLHPTDRSKSIIFGNNKTDHEDKDGDGDKDDGEGGIYCYALDGEPTDTLSPDTLGWGAGNWFDQGKKVNNVDVRYNFQAGSEQWDLVVGGNRTDERIDIFRVDTDAGGDFTGLTQVGSIQTDSNWIPSGNNIGNDSPYGLAMFHSKSQNKLYAIASSKGGRVAQWEMSYNAGTELIDPFIEGTRVWMTPLVAFEGDYDFNELVEGIVADDEKDVVYIAGENTSIYRYQTLNGVIQDAGRVTVASVGDGNLTADIEGLTMYYASDGEGYLIASSQGSSQYAVYEREFSGTAANAYIKNFSIVGNAHTDGIDVVNVNLGGSFTDGMFLAHSGGGSPSNIRLVSWADVANATGPTLLIDTSWDPRSAGFEAPQTVLITENAEGWAYMQSLDSADPPDDVDPAVHPVYPDDDFDETWNDRSSFGYHVAASYDGPPFTIGATAPFSYGLVDDIDGGTTLTGPQGGTRHTAWFLKEVDGGAGGYSNLTLKLLADDGAFVYLNGRLIASKNMPLGGDDTWALFSATEGPDGDFDNEPLLNDPVLTPGLTNLLAVSVHQEHASSSDLGLKLELSGDVGGVPDLAFLGADEITQTTATVRWVTTSAGDATLRFGVAEGVYDTTLYVSGSVTSHEIALSGLTSDTTYFFEAETSGSGSFNATGTGSFTTLEGPNDISLARGPYLQSASHDRITFWWRTSQLGNNSTVHYGTTSGSLTSSEIVSGSTKKEHTIPVTGLAADTKYYYKLETDNGVGGNWVSPEYFFETSPSPGAKHPTRIWVIGDSGRADRNAKNVYEAFRSYNGQDHTDVWLMLGDNAYEKGTQEEYQEAVFDMYPELLSNTPLWSTRGNHDDEGPYFDIFDFPTGGGCGGVSSGTEEYYSFDYGNIHFVCLDSDEKDNYLDTLADATPGMADWLQSDLEATTADWIIAFFHHGPYTRGSHNSDGKHHNEMRANTLSILEDYGVDLILSGHSHCYERSHLLDGHYGTFRLLTMPEVMARTRAMVRRGAASMRMGTLV